MSTYLLKGGIVATLVAGSSEGRVYKADVLVEDGTIKEIAENIPAGPGVEVIDVEGKWITPGMIDTHRHVFMNVLRASQADWLLSEYLVKMSWTIQCGLTPDEVRIGQLSGCLEALHSGVTTLVDHSHAALTPAHAEASLEATVHSGARVIWCPARQSPVTKLFPSMEFAVEEETRKWQLDLLKQLAKRDGGKLSPDGRVTLGFAYDLAGRGPASTDQEVMRYVRSLPVSLITAHVVRGPAILTWRDAGILGPDVLFSHCNALDDHPEVDDEMWAAMKEHQCAIGSTPEDELGMAHGNPVAFQAVERGVKCGLGVDCLSINSGDLFTQMRFALQYARGRAHDDTWKNKKTPPKHNTHNSIDAFRLATLGGAEAVNMAHLIGSIEVGKKADLLVFDTLSVNLAGALDPFQAIVFNASSADVELVMVNGEIVKRDGKLTKVEWGPIAKELREKALAVRERFPVALLEERWEKYYTEFGPMIV